MLAFVHTNLLLTEGIHILLFLSCVGLVSFFYFRPLFYIALGFLLFSFYFFRNPERVCRQAQYDDAVIICPADGKVVDIQYDNNGGFGGYHQKVSIFLSPFDVHVQWAPVAGIVKKVKYRGGTFSLAFLPKSSELNERNDVQIRCSNGRTIIVRQIAGTVARRIRCWVSEGDRLEAGHKYGMIKFGSRVDLLLPANVELAVGLGQRVYGGQTVTGRWM